MNIKNEPVLFNEEQIKNIEKHYHAKYVCPSEHRGKSVEVFYGDKAHPASGSRYFALYYASHTNELMITNGSFIEEQEIDAVIADDGDTIYSRHRHDYRKSNDDSVWIDGGRSYTRSGMYPEDKWCILKVKNGTLQINQPGDKND